MSISGKNLGKGLVPFALAVTLATAGCVARNDVHGYVPVASDVAAIQTGQDTRASVLEKLGRPSIEGMVDGAGLYYVTYTLRNYGPFKPQELERTVLAITFDSRDVVRNVETYGLSDGRVVALNRRVTDDGVRDTTLLRQLLGNIGQLDASQIFGSD